VAPMLKKLVRNMP